MMYPIPTLGKEHSMILYDENQREIQSSPLSFMSDHTSFIIKENNFLSIFVASQAYNPSYPVIPYHQQIL